MTPAARPAGDGNRSISLWSIGKLALLVAAGAFTIIVLGGTDPATSYRPTGPPRPVPDQQLATVSEREFGGMLVGLEGKPVVVNVWASWCPPCRAEMPLLQRAANTYEDAVVFIGVASRDTHPSAAEFLAEVDITYPNIFDASGGIRRALAVRAFPTTYFFDRSGVLQAAVPGGITEGRLAAQIEDLLR